MGKLRGFIEIERLKPSSRPVDERVRDWREFELPLPEAEAARSGRALHGLRHPVLPRRLSAREPHPRLQRSRLRRALGRGAARAARDQQLPRDHRAGLPGAVRGVVRAQPRRGAGDDQDDRAQHHRSRVRARARCRRSRRRARPASASPSSARGRPGWPRRSSWRARATTSWCSRRTIASAACCATASPTSSWRRTLLDRRLEQMSAEGVTLPAPACTAASTSPATSCAREYDAVVLAGGAMKPRDLDVPGRELDGVHFAMDFLTQQNRRVAGARRRRRRRSSPTGKRVVVLGGGDTGSDCVGTSHRQGAASRDLARADAAAARRARASATRGRSGRSSTARRRRTKRAASATSRS